MNATRLALLAWGVVVAGGVLWLVTVAALSAWPRGLDSLARWTECVSAHARWVERARVGFLVLAILGGLAGLLLAVVPPAGAANWLDSLAPDGRADFFRADLLARLKPVLALGGVLGLGLALGLVYWRAPARGLIAAVATGFGRLTRAAASDFRQLLMARPSFNWHEGLILSGMIGLGLGLRLMFVNQPIRYDEAFTFTNYASQSLTTAITNICLPNNHVFHTLLVRGAYSVFGNELWAIRLPAFAASLLAIPLTYAAARRLYGGSVGLMAAGLVASSSALVEYAANARGYSLVGFFTLGLLMLALRVKSSGNLANWIMIVVVAVLGLLTMPTMVYPLGGLYLWLLAAWAARDVDPAYRATFLRYLFVSGAVIGALAAVLYAPGLLTCGPHLISHRAIQPTDVSALGGNVGRSLLATWTQWQRDVPRAMTAVLVVGLGVHVAFLRKLNRERVPLMLVLLGWFALVIIVMRKISPNPRIWLFAIPLYGMWAAAGLVFLLQRLRLERWIKPDGAVLALAAILALVPAAGLWQSRSVYYSPETGALQDGEAITAFLAPQLQPGDAVISIVPSDAVLAYYFDRQTLPPSYIFYREAPTPFERAFVVVNTLNNQTLEFVLGKLEMEDQFAPGSLELIETFDTAQVYRGHRLQ